MCRTTVIFGNRKYVLRVRALAIRLEGSAMFTATFNLVAPGYTCQTTLIFGILKDRNVLIHSLASFQSGSNDLSKMVKKV